MIMPRVHIFSGTLFRVSRTIGTIDGLQPLPFSDGTSCDLLQMTSVLMLLVICLNFWLATYVIFLTLPFALVAFVGVGLAIYCGWRTGIWLFIGACRQHTGCRCSLPCLTAKLL